MRELPRTVEEVRKIRGDLSSWLVHLTKDNTFNQKGQMVFWKAKQCLEHILQLNTLFAVSAVGQFNYQDWYKNVTPNDLNAVCFTEAPLDEIFLFTNIKFKSLKFSCYGLVFDREEMSKAPVFAAPVLYFSQPDGDKHFLDVFNQMEQQHYQQYREILYLFDRFGKTLKGKDYNFRWEREWRVKGNLNNVKSHVKFGLCPEPDIDYFEQLFPSIPFVDPFFNARQIACKLELRGIKIR